MKIGILTLPLHSNYGGLLQVFALQLYLTRRGHEVIVIDRQFNRPFYSPFLDIVKKTFFRSKVKKQAEYNIIVQHTDYFIKNYIRPKTLPYTSNRSLKEGFKKYQFDALIVGSDQVWRQNYTKERSENYFFDFSKNYNVKKLSYAASFGTDSWNESVEKTERIKKLLKQFSSISVREDSGVVLCSSIFDVSAKQHVDPTLLLSTADYMDLIEKEGKIKSKGDVLVYMLDIDEDREKVINIICSSLGGSAFSIGKPQNAAVNTLKEKIYPKVSSWIQGFFDAKFVVTDSFHGTIFSILFNKPFVIYGNKTRGLARFYSILKKINLENRIILNSNDLTDELLNQSIDWSIINEKLEKERNKTDKYFKVLEL